MVSCFFVLCKHNQPSYIQEIRMATTTKNRRRIPRIPHDTVATITVGFVSYGCRLKDFSILGTRFVILRTPMPSELVIDRECTITFTTQLDDKALITRQCRIVRIEGNEIGAEFVMEKRKLQCAQCGQIFEIDPMSETDTVASHDDDICLACKKLPDESIHWRQRI